MLFSGVDKRLVQIHHQDQLFVPVESLLVFSAQLFCLLLGVNDKNTLNISENNHRNQHLMFLYDLNFLSIKQMFITRIPHTVLNMADYLYLCIVLGMFLA